MATFQPNSRTIYANPSTYTPDFSFLDTMLKRKEAQYNQGFAQVSQKYSTLAQDVSRKDSLERRDKFLAQAKENLKNISALDLSLQENVEAAGKVFSPLYEDEDLLGDISLTRHYNTQRSIADSFRLKDGGKEYNNANLQYVLMQQEDFVNDKNPSNWKKYMATRRSYEPYADYSKKYQDAYKDFKPSITVTPSIEGKNGEWLVSTKDASVKSEEFRRHLESYLSPQEKRQLEIEGVVKYGRTANQVKDVYVKNIESRITDINNSVKALNDKKVTYKSKDDIKALDDLISQYETPLKTLNEQLVIAKTKKIEDYQDIKDGIAASLYYDEKLDEFGKSAERKDITKEIKVSDVWKTNFEQAGRMSLERLQHQNKINEIKLQGQNAIALEQYKNLNGGPAEYNEDGSRKQKVQNFTGGITPLKSNSSSNVIADLDTKHNEADERIKNIMVKYAHDLNMPVDKATNHAVQVTQERKQLKEVVDPKNPNIKYLHNEVTGVDYKGVDYNKKMLEFKIHDDMKANLAPNLDLQKTINLKKKQIEKQVKDQNKELYTQLETELNSGRYKYINIDGKPLSKLDFYNGLINGNIKPIASAPGLRIPSVFGSTNTNTSSSYKYEINGVVYNMSSKQSQDFIDELNNVKGKGIGKKYSEAREKTLNEIGVRTTSGETGAHIDPKSKLGTYNINTLNTMFGSGWLDDNTMGVREKPGVIVARLKDATKLKEFLTLTKDNPNVKYDEVNKVFRVVNTATDNSFANYNEWDLRTYDLANLKFNGNKTKDGAYELYPATSFRIPGLNDEFYWKRTRTVSQNAAGDPEYNDNFNIFVDGLPNVSINTTGGISINSSEQLIDYIHSLKNNPLATKTIVNSFKNSDND